MLGKLGVAEAAHGNNLDADVSSQPSMCTHLAVGSCNTSQVCITEENAHVTVQSVLVAMWSGGAVPP